MFQLIDGFHRFAAKNLHRILIRQVITPLDGIEHVPFPAVFFEVTQRRADASLGGARVRADGIELADHGHTAVPGEIQGGHQTGSTGADDDRIVSLVHE